MIPYPSSTSEASPPRALDRRDALRSLGALVELMKPGVTRMVLATTACGAAIAPGRIRDYSKLGWAVLGTALIVAAANALNMYLEGDVDARSRPVACRRKWRCCSARALPSWACRFSTSS
jgi:heme O synthase-like polyprenyltransferase